MAFTALGGAAGNLFADSERSTPTLYCFINILCLSCRPTIYKLFDFVHLVEISAYGAFLG
jgi:hypothetical protein